MHGLPVSESVETCRYPENSFLPLNHKVFVRFHKEDPLSVSPSGIKPLGESKPSGKVRGVGKHPQFTAVSVKKTEPNYYSSVS